MREVKHPLDCICESCVSDLENQIQQLQSENEALKKQVELLERHYEKAIAGWQDLIDKLSDTIKETK